VVAYQGDGHRLRVCRLQSSQSRKLIANLQNAESCELSTRYWKLSNLAIHLPCDFSVDVPLAEITTQHRDTHDWSYVLSRPHWTVQFSEAAWISTTGSIVTSQGKHWSRTARHTGPRQTSTKSQPMWIVHGGLQYATAIVTSPKKAPHRVRQSSAKKELTDSGCSEEKCRKRKEKPKVLRVAGTRVPRQKARVCCAREKAASKSHLLGRRESAHRDATFLLPSVSCRVTRSRVFIFLKFLNWKMWR